MADDKTATTTKGKRGRKPLPKGVMEKRVLLSNEDVQRLNILLSIMYNDEDDGDKTEYDKTSLFVRDAIRKTYDKFNEDGTIMKHLSALSTN